MKRSGVEFWYILAHVGADALVRSSPDEGVWDYMCVT